MELPNDRFTLFGLEIKYYGIILSCGILVAILLASLLAKKRGLKSDFVINFALIVVPLGIIGARLLYVLTSGYDYTFVEALKIWNGGLSIYGAMIGGAIGVLICCKIYKINFWAAADVILPGMLLAQGIGRWGNFFNQEAYGPVVEGIRFPFAVFIEQTGQWHMACFFWEFLFNIVGFVILLLILLKTKQKGLVAGCYFIWYGAVRFVIEFYRQDPLVLLGMRFSQFLSALAVIGGICLVIYSLKRKKKENKQKELNNV